jgi:hypothetical protein
VAAVDPADQKGADPSGPCASNHGPPGGAAVRAAFLMSQSPVWASCPTPPTSPAGRGRHTPLDRTRDHEVNTATRPLLSWRADRCITVVYR